MVVSIKVTDAKGQEHSVVASLGSTVMEVLRPLSIGVTGDCGGSISCGTCHVWVARTGSSGCRRRRMTSQEVLDREYHAGPLSRLCCQIRVEAGTRRYELDLCHHRFPDEAKYSRTCNQMKNAPKTRPSSPFFSSGPCKKRPRLEPWEVEVCQSRVVRTDRQRERLGWPKHPC